MRLFARVLGLSAVLVASGFAVTPALADAGSEENDASPPPPSPDMSVAQYCEGTDYPELQCLTAPLSFAYSQSALDGLPNYDSGWIPEDFKQAQVRLFFRIPAQSDVSMAGNLLTSWPGPLTIEAVGNSSTGKLAIDFGIDLKVRAKIDLSVWDWEGDVPYIPKVDFHLKNSTTFDPWAFAPNPAIVSAQSARATLLSVNLLSLLSVPKAIGEAGIKLDIGGELRATYQTESIDVTTQTSQQEEPVSVTITEQGQKVPLEYKGESWLDLLVSPKGGIKYDGVIHLYPTVYIKSKFGLFDFDFPVYDYPINLTELLSADINKSFRFPAANVRVPLPNIPAFEEPAVLDFGKVLVNSNNTKSLDLPNTGQALAKAEVTVESGSTAEFKVQTMNVKVEPGATDQINVSFRPKKVGSFEAQLKVASNDPDLPEQIIQLKGTAVAKASDLDDDDDDLLPDGGKKPRDDGGNADYDADTDDGCGCRVASGTNHSPWMWFAVGFVAAGALVRRRRQSRWMNHTNTD